MKDYYNLDAHIPLKNFPWQEVYIGIAKSKKNASIFYGHDATESSTIPVDYMNDYASLSPEQRVWYRSAHTGMPLKGLDILLTHPVSWQGSWYRIDDPEYWKPTPDHANFKNLINWINNSGIFSGTGRIIFFIQLQHQHTPPHKDENPENIPEGYSQHREFIWLTPPHNPKKLLVNGKSVGNVAWFNSYETHETIAEDNIRWSLRIDGKFSSAFWKLLEKI